MARNSAGKWVARAGATGAGRTYRGQAPVNWYAALVVIVLLGVLSVLFAGHEYRTSATGTATSTTHPTTSTTWFAGINFNICGKTHPPLTINQAPASTTKIKQSFYTSGDGVIGIAPKSNTDAGKNAVLGKFVSSYTGLVLTATSLRVPGTKNAVTYKNGDTCPKGTPDAGKQGQVVVTYWSSAFDNKAKPTTVSGDPATLRFTDNQLISVGFVPPGTQLKKNTTVVEALLHASTGGTTTSTTAPTTAPSSTSTTAAASSTTTTAAPATTTSTPKTSTSTTTK